jgi:hypothetical protein
VNPETDQWGQQRPDSIKDAIECAQKTPFHGEFGFQSSSSSSLLLFSGFVAKRLQQIMIDAFCGFQLLCSALLLDGPSEASIFQANCRMPHNSV